MWIGVFSSFVHILGERCHIIWSCTCSLIPSKPLVCLFIIKTNSASCGGSRPHILTPPLDHTPTDPPLDHTPTGPPLDHTPTEPFPGLLGVGMLKSVITDPLYTVYTADTSLSYTLKHCKDLHMQHMQKHCRLWGDGQFFTKEQCFTTAIVELSDVDQIRHWSVHDML